jgi:hypothetical protein
MKRKEKKKKRKEKEKGDAVEFGGAEKYGDLISYPPRKQVPFHYTLLCVYSIISMYIFISSI